MRKIIDGKVYDSETAKKIGQWKNDYTCDHSNYCEESLFLKKTGEFFIHGYGGTMSKYAKKNGNNKWSDSSVIKPIPFAKAKKWAMEMLNGEEYEANFGLVTEDENRITISISITTSTHEKLKRLNRERANTSISKIIEKMVLSKLNYPDDKKSTNFTNVAIIDGDEDNESYIIKDNEDDVDE
jgi:hypothetical protein